MHPVIKKSDFYWIYANKYIVMERLIVIYQDKIKWAAVGEGGRRVQLGWGGGMGRKGVQL